MSATVCILPAAALDYPEGGGHLWVYLNWALGLRAHGCRVVWLEILNSSSSAERNRENISLLRKQLATFGFEELLIISPASLDLEAAAEADLLLNFRYSASRKVISHFRRSALVDIDPGLLQLWKTSGEIEVAPHDLYFTIGETVGKPGAHFPDCGVRWHYTPPPVFLEEWPVVHAEAGTPYTTVTHWWSDEIKVNGEKFRNDKRASFIEYLDLPAHSPVPIELAVCLGDDETAERQLWQSHGWRIEHPWEISRTPADYRAYIHRSRGEFSCAKPSCMRLQNAWISDRTICYLASGKPAIVQHTGPSSFLPDHDGLFRFHTLDEAARALRTVEADYDKHCARARAFAEEHFDAVRVAGNVLDKALA